MRIVIIVNCFFPNAGYLDNILPKYFVKRGHEVHIVTSEMDKVPAELKFFFGEDNILGQDLDYEKLYGVKIHRISLHAYYSGRPIFKKDIFRIIDGLNPDVLLISGNASVIGVQYLFLSRDKPYKVVFYTSMVEMASKNPFRKIFFFLYRNIVTPMIIKRGIPIIRTQDEDYVEKRLGIPLNMCPWISYGSDLLLFHPDENRKAVFKREYGLSREAFVVVFAGKLVPSKGAKLLAETFKTKFSTEREVVLVVVGNTSGEYGKEVEDIFKRSENRVLRFPTQMYVDLPKFYQVGDIAVFAKECSLSFYDVQACGLPVVSENNVVNVDRNSHGNGDCFKADDVADFRRKIEKFINMPKEEFEEYRQSSLKFIAENYDYQDKADEYLQIMINECEKGKK